MFVALSNVVMLLSQIIIIYLAAAAPFGVASFLQRPADLSRSRSLMHAAGAALLWPMILLSRLITQHKLPRPEPDAPPEIVSVSHELRIDDARRALLSVLYRTEDVARDISSSETEAARRSVCTVSAAVESYVGLSLAVGANEDASPRALELWRIAGRADEVDLRVASHCHRRRDRQRLTAHQANSRIELLHALAGLREVCEKIQAATTKPGDPATRHLFATLVEVYARAFDLFSLFEDERAAMRTARLLDAVCARLQRGRETFRTQVAPESLVRQNTKGNVARRDEPCTTSIQHTTATPQPQLTPTTIRAHG